MGQVTVTLNGRSYRLRCGDGEEQRLLDLSEHIRQRIDDLSYEFGNSGDERLLLMAALMLTDELWDAKARLAALEAGPEAEPPAPESADNVRPAPEPVAEPPPAAAKPEPGLQARSPAPESVAAPPPASGGLVQGSSLKRALGRPQAPRASLSDRLAVAQAPSKSGGKT